MPNELINVVICEYYSTCQNVKSQCLINQNKFGLVDWYGLVINKLNLNKPHSKKPKVGN